MSHMMSIEQVKALIEAGKWLALAGEESLLKQLPKGNWIGGTIPYFMSEEGGVHTNRQIYVTELQGMAGASSIRSYNRSTLPRIVPDGPENGFSLIIIPAGSEVHQVYAKEAPNYSGLFMRPIIGWVSGVDLANLGKTTPKVFNGTTGLKSDHEVVALHMALDENKLANIDIINLFAQGEGDSIAFEEDGFSAKTALINGKKSSLAKYLTERNINTQLPLVADYNGAMINISFQSINTETDEVNFYAPVFAGLEYRIASPVKDYVQEFNALIQQDATTVIFSCNCILNYLYSSLEGKKTGDFTGPITFGEIAYQLLNQTLTYLTITDR